MASPGTKATWIAGRRPGNQGLKGRKRSSRVSPLNLLLATGQLEGVVGSVCECKRESVTFGEPWGTGKAREKGGFLRNGFTRQT